MESISQYLEQYSKSLKKTLGEKFSLATFNKQVKTHTDLTGGLRENNFLPDFDLPWLDELKVVTEKILAIASSPRTHIKFEKEVKKSELAVKIDNYDIIETLKVPKFWRRKGGTYLPEYVYTDLYEIELAIYENRFIINLIDKMMQFLSQIIAKLYAAIKKIDENFVNYLVSMSDIEILHELAKFDGFKYTNSKLRHSENANARARGSLLTTSDSPYVKALQEVITARNTLSHVRSTPFYTVVKRAKALSDSDIHPTNMLLGDPTYAPCYNFYRKLLTLLSQNRILPIKVNMVDYHNYVMTHILAAFNDLGFVSRDAVCDFTFENNVLTNKKITLMKDQIRCVITFEQPGHIDLKFKFWTNYVLPDDQAELDKLKGAYSSKVSIDLYPTIDEMNSSDQELIGYFRKKINYRINHDGYMNAFIITTVDNTQKEDVIICSPYLYKIDANVKTMIDSCIIFTEADKFVYSHICPVCGYYHDGEQDDGNCYCPHCDSVFSNVTTGDNKRSKDNIWIKRLKNPERE